MDVKDKGGGGGGRCGPGLYDSKRECVLGSSNTVINTAVFRDVMTCSLVEQPTVRRILFRPSSRLKTLDEDKTKFLHIVAILIDYKASHPTGQ